MQNTAQKYQVGDRIIARVLHSGVDYLNSNEYGNKWPKLENLSVSRVSTIGEIIQVRCENGFEPIVSGLSGFRLKDIELPKAANPLSHLSYTDLNSIRNKAYILGHKALYDAVDTELNNRYNNLNQFYVQS